MICCLRQKGKAYRTLSVLTFHDSISILTCFFNNASRHDFFEIPPHKNLGVMFSEEEDSIIYYICPKRFSQCWRGIAAR